MNNHQLTAEERMALAQKASKLTGMSITALLMGDDVALRLLAEDIGPDESKTTEQERKSG